MGDMPRLHRASLNTTAADLRSGTIRVRDYLEHVQSRIAALDSHIRAFVPEHDRRRRLNVAGDALEASAGDAADRPPLYGVAVGVKDCFSVEGLPTRAGSSLPAHLFAAPQSSAVSVLRAAGTVVVGKTAMDEFAYCEPAPTRNPHNLEHTPGGSSSGSAAAVAAGLCPLALGTQTSRSVIGPAAFCGVVGFKPTFGRVALDGVVPLSPSFDTVGMFTQDVAGMTLAAGVLISDWQPTDSTTRPTLGVPEGRFLSWTLPAGRQFFESHVARLARAGFQVRRIPFFSDDELEEMDDRAMMLLHGEMARAHAQWIEPYSTLYRPRTARAIRRGQAVTDAELSACRAHREAFRERIELLMREAGIDIWVTPASAGPAPAGLDLTGWGGMTTAWSYAGLPCIAVPAGRDGDRLPLGLQCVAGSNCDEHLLAWVPEIEAVLSGTANA